MASTTGDEAKLRSLLLLSSSSADHIVDVCRTAEAVLEGLHSPAQARNFAAFFLPPLLQKIFGFRPQENALPSSPSLQSKSGSQLPPSSSSPAQGWLSVISFSPNDVACKTLISLLAPSGVLFTSLAKLDKQNSSLRFVFPTERLPAWVQDSVKGVPSSSHLPKGAHSPSPVPKLFADRIKPISGGASQVQLDVFEYFFFWFAYYAVCEPERGGPDTVKEQPNKESSAFKAQRKSFPNWVAGLHNHRPSLTNWVSVHHTSPQKDSNISANVDPYLQLLQIYLAHHVPAFASSRVSPSFARWEHDRPATSALTRMPSRSAFLVQTLTAFWLVDEGSNVVAAFVPPRLLLTDAVRVLVNHINNVTATFSGWSVSYTYHQILQRPLYCFVWRAFRSWTAMVPVEKASRIVDIWLDFLQPWFSEGNIYLSSEAAASPGVFTERWRGFVSENFLFYTNLIVYSLEFALKHLHLNLEAVLKMTSKILNVLAGSPGLVDYLKHLSSLLDNDDAELVRKSSVLVATIWDQLQRLEDVDCNMRNGCSNMTSWTHLRLFSKESNGGGAILELLILQAEGEIQMVSHTTYGSCCKALEAIKRAGSILFSTKLVASPISIAVPEVGHGSHGSHSFQASTALPQHTWKDVKYKGDWMRRPIESTEFAWLVRGLVQLSDTINASLDLGQDSDVPDLDCLNEIVDQRLDGDAVDSVGVSIQDSPDLFLDFNLVKLAAFIWWCMWSRWSILVKFIRVRGWRINLRFLARKPIAVAAILLSIHLLRILIIRILSLF